MRAWTLYVVVLMFSLMFLVPIIPGVNTGVSIESTDYTNFGTVDGSDMVVQSVNNGPIPVSAPKLSPVEIIAPSNTIDFEARKAAIFASVDKNSNQIHDALEETISTRASTNSLDTPVDVIVAVRDGQLDAAIRYFQTLGGSLTKRYEGAFYGLAGSISASSVEDLAKFGDVELVEEDQQMVRFSDVATQLTNVRTYVWDTLGYTGDPNSAIAILDTGIDDSHTMLSPYASLDFTNGKVVGWYDATADGSTSPEDMNSHGSHCAGIAAGKEYDAQLPDGRIRTTWGIKYALTSSNAGYFTYYIQVKNTGTIEIMTLWDGDVNVTSNDVHLIAPNGTIADSVYSSASQRNLTAVVDANSLGIWSIKIHVSYPTNGGEFRAVGINVYPYDSPTDSHGRFSGVAPDAKLVGVKVFDNTGSGSSTDLVDGLDWVYNNAQTYHITVASMSLGFSGTVAAVDTATANLVSRGVVTVVAAGNDGQGANNINTPGHVNEVICVAASGDHNRITDYSSEGPGQLDTMKPDLAAPGGVSSQGAILSVDSNDQEADGAFTEQQPNDMAIMQGTSMACPYVAGLAALLVDAMGGYSSWTYGSTAKPYTVKQLLMMTSYEINTINRGDKDTVEGYGRVNADAALEAYLYEHTIGTSESNTIVSGDIGRKAWARHMTLTAGTTYTFSLDVPDGADFDLFLYDGAYDTYGEPILLAKSINFAPGASEHITFTPSSTGTYYIVVKYVTGNGGAFTFSSQSGSDFPSVDIVTPAEGAQLTGGITVQVAASGTGLSSVALRFWNDTWVDITGNYNSGSGYYEYTMNVSCLESGNVTFIARASNAAGSSYDSSNVWVQTYSPQILLVDDDNGAAFETYYKDALTALGYPQNQGFDIWTVSTDGSPSVATLQSYEIVIWFTSDDYQNTLTSTDQSNLATFLNNGGKLFISGQDIGYNANSGGWTQWIADNLHASYVADDTDGTNVDGVSGDAVFDGVSYAIGGGDGGGNNAYPDQISATNGGVLCLEYDNTTSLGAAVRYNGTSRVVYFGFNFEAISYASDREDALSRILDFLGVDSTPVLNVSSPKRDSWVPSPFDVVYSASDDVSVSYVEFYLDGQYKTRSTSGNVSITSSEGDHTLRVIAVDSLGQITVRRIVLHVDSTDPVVTFVSPSAGAVVKSGTSVDVEVSDAHLDMVQYCWDSGAWQNFTSPYDTNVPAGDGTHTLYVRAYDIAGNMANTSRQFVCDDTAPTISLISPATGSVEKSGTTIDTSVSDLHLSTVYYRWDSDAWSVFSSPYDTALPSGDGSHTLYVNATDEAGNYQLVSYTFTTDDTAPVITLLSPANNTEQPGGTTVDLDVGDTNLATVYYRWDSDSWAVLPSPYNTQIPSSQGTHILYVNATDEAGNPVFEKYVWTVPTPSLPPDVDLISPSNGSVRQSGTLIDLNITDVNDDLSTVYYHWDTDGWAVLSSPYDTSLPAGDGVHTLYINATDAAGNFTFTYFTFITDDTAPTITLVSPADGSDVNTGTTIILSISDANALVLTVYNWDATPNSTLSSPYHIVVSGLSEGSHILHVHAEDEAGNPGYAAYTFVVDDTAPTISLNSPSDGSEIQSGTDIDLGVTDANLDTVYYSWDGGANVTLNSPYDIDTTGLSEGTHNLTVYAEDAAGNLGIASYHFVIDDTAPSITLIAPSNGAEITSSTWIDLDVNDSNTLVEVVYNWDATSNSTLASPYDVDTSGLSEGNHTLFVHARDDAGNWRTAIYSFMIDDTSPTISLTSPTDGSEIQPGVAIDLDISDSNTLSQVLYNWDGGTNTTLPAPYNVSTLSLSDGTHVLNVYAEDEAGNWASSTFSFVIDSIAPTILLNSPLDGSEIQSGTVIDLSVSDNNTLQSVYYHWDGDANSTLSSPFDVSTAGLSEGNHTLWIHAVDVAGNWRTESYSFVIDDTPPVITLTSPANSSVFVSGTVIHFSIGDDNTLSQVTYNWDGGANQVLSSPYDVNTNGLSEGEHWLYISAEDAAGNVESLKYRFVVDDTAPSIILNSPADGSEIQSSELIDLTISDANLDYAQYRWDSGAFVTLSSPFDVPAAGLNEGSHTLTVYAYDLAGNGHNVTYSFIVDDSAPAITLQSPPDGSEINSGTLISFDITDANTIVTTLYRWDGGANVSFASPYNVDTTGLSEGSHMLDIYACDAAGNWNHGSYSFIVDDTAPVIILNAPSNDSVVPTGSIVDLDVTETNTLSSVQYSWDSGALVDLSSPYDITISGLSEGSHILDVYATDAAGNNAHVTYQFTVDDTAPMIALLYPVNETVQQSGVVVEVSITELHLSTVRYHWDSNSWTPWSSPYQTSIPSGDGMHYLYVEATDEAGNVATITVAYEVDDTLPDIVLNGPANYTTHHSGSTIDLSVSDANLVAVYYHWDTDGWAVLSSPYDTTLPTGDGEHELYVNASDAAGNWQYVRYVFVSDDAIPQVILNSPSNNTVQNSGVLVDVSISDNDLDTVLFHWDGGSWAVWAAPYDTYLPTGDGQHSLYVLVNDTAGNEESVRFVFTTDDSSPTIVLLSPLNETAHRSGITMSLDITDSHSFTVTIQWDGGSWDALTSPFETLLPAGDGNHILLVNATDLVGNSRLVCYTFVVDDSDPVISLFRLQNNTFYQSGIAVEVNVTDTGTVTVEFAWDGGGLQTWVEPYTTTLPASDGEHQLIVRATDEVGNQEEVLFVFQVDDTTPVVSLDSPASGTVQVSGTTVYFSVSDSNLDVVRLAWDTSAWSEVVSPYSTAIPSGDGDHTLRINASDKAGNYVVATFTFTVDDSAPEVSLVTPSNNTLHRSGVAIQLSIEDEHLDYVRVKWDEGSWVSLFTPFTTQLPSGDGYHVLEIEVSDEVSNTVSLRFVFITDDTPPSLTSPEDIEYSEGTIGNSVEWTVSDLHPANYTVYLDGVILEAGTWDDQSTISVSVDGLASGEHNLTIVVVDTVGNMDSDTVWITVTSPTGTSTTSTDTTTETTSTSPTTTDIDTGAPNILGLDFEIFIVLVGASFGIVLSLVIVILRKGRGGK